MNDDGKMVQHCKQFRKLYENDSAVIRDELNSLSSSHLKPTNLAVIDTNDDFCDSENTLNWPSKPICHHHGSSNKVLPEKLKYRSRNYKFLKQLRKGRKNSRDNNNNNNRHRSNVLYRDQDNWHMNSEAGNPFNDSSEKGQDSQVHLREQKLQFISHTDEVSSASNLISKVEEKPMQKFFDMISTAFNKTNNNCGETPDIVNPLENIDFRRLAQKIENFDLSFLKNLSIKNNGKTSAFCSLIFLIILVIVSMSKLTQMLCILLALNIVVFIKL
ncbi:hypothetical protein SNEBB_011324 [Seison nebaliae]|nr:hypothetical protein SNEBB_011324 [Seison nebaliae]